MKFWSFLIAIMILVLSCMPCSDAGAIVPTRNQTSAAAGDRHPGGHQEEHRDLCSPFCQCSCCSLAYALPLLPTQSPAAVLLSRNNAFPLLIQQCPAGIALTIWQPPRFC
ncbi:DUF6660 family protein [Taibaiella koreensis]|uniref:DUF6660 family protein n=1 Tax=Taibaiella koreensis TaxID=1268548 RepID=UPI0013C2A878|nr:DUF6660 family protein [Taibaiella koreensis]